jgi:hypothetical protein
MHLFFPLSKCLDGWQISGVKNVACLFLNLRIKETGHLDVDQGYRYYARGVLHT